MCTKISQKRTRGNGRKAIFGGHMCMSPNESEVGTDEESVMVIKY